MNQIPQPQIIYPNIHSQIPNDQIQNDFSQQIPLQNQITQISQNNISSNLKDEKKRRRSKHELEGRIYKCECGKSYLSQPALNNHKKNKHPELLEGIEKRGRGRPKKFNKNNNNDFENKKYENFFEEDIRKKNVIVENFNIKNVVINVFDFLFNGKFSDKLFSHINNINDNPILRNLISNNEIIIKKDKNLKTADDIFYEYLNECKNKTNEKYFTIILKFILLFRECENLSKNKNKEKEKYIEFTSISNAENLPELCNEFYNGFLEVNNFFDINNEDDKREIIELIQHFCIWLFKNDYTKSKLSLA